MPLNQLELSGGGETFRLRNASTLAPASFLEREDMALLAPGQCLVLYSGDSAPDMPPGCELVIGEQARETAFWREGFRANPANNDDVTCPPAAEDGASFCIVPR